MTRNPTENNCCSVLLHSLLLRCFVPFFSVCSLLLLCLLVPLFVFLVAALSSCSPLCVLSSCPVLFPVLFVFHATALSPNKFLFPSLVHLYSLYSFLLQYTFSRLLFIFLVAALSSCSSPLCIPCCYPVLFPSSYCIPYCCYFFCFPFTIPVAALSSSSLLLFVFPAAALSSGLPCGYLNEAAQTALCLYEYRWYVDCPRLIFAASLLGLHCLSMYSLQGFK